jgi:hypothetical protein
MIPQQGISISSKKVPVIDADGWYLKKVIYE